MSKHLLVIVLLSSLVGAAQAQDSATSPAPKSTTQVTSVFSGLKVYPNPWRSDKNANQVVTFSPLPSESTVKIFTTSGHWVKTLSAGTNTWDLTNANGDKVASGVYLYVATLGNTSDKSEGKIVVIK